MENKEIENLEEVELVEATEDEMGPEERTDEFGIPAEDVELDDFEEEENEEEE